VRTTVSVRGQTVIPYPIREALGITQATELQWSIKNGMIIILPIPADPVKASVGILKGRGPTSEELLVERKTQREMER
jgi:AbrB family looped-hinge helix DNA binding protein